MWRAGVKDGASSRSFDSNERPVWISLEAYWPSVQFTSASASNKLYLPATS
jgi:hypothetical protein